MKVTTAQALAASLVHHNAATNSRLLMLAGVVVAAVSSAQTQYAKDGSETTPTLDVVYDTIKARGNKVFAGENRTAWDNYAPKAFAFARKVLDSMPQNACIVRAVDADSVTDAINAVVALFTALDITNPARLVTWGRKPGCGAITKADIATYSDNAIAAKKAAEAAKAAKAAEAAKAKAAEGAASAEAVASAEDAAEEATATATGKKKLTPEEKIAAAVAMVMKSNDMAWLRAVSAAISERMEALEAIAVVEAAPVEVAKAA